LAKNESHLLNLIQPLSSALLELNKKTQELEKDRVSAFSSLDNEIKRVITTNQTLANETMALKNALKKPHVRGRWGEVQLKNCIDLAGMSEYCDVSFQHVTNDLDEQQRYIPDMVVRMPGGRNVVVDAKTPLEAFITALESADDSERALQMARHGRHVKEHVKKLSTKDYASVVKGSADFTVLFLPNESFLYAALESEPQRMEFALERKILIATPPTLIGLLKVISYGWNEEKLAENAARISEVGIELHKRVCDFVETYENVGKYLSKAHEEFEAGQTRLNSRVIVQAKKLERLGAKSKKDLPMIEGFEDSSLVEADDSLA
jgi:DNA recombination protein RmuC